MTSNPTGTESSPTSTCPYQKVVTRREEQTMTSTDAASRVVTSVTTVSYTTLQNNDRQVSSSSNATIAGACPSSISSSSISQAPISTAISNIHDKPPRVIPITTTSTSTESPSPLVHAIGGSIGSALAIFLLYPLERARIEMQSSASSSSSSSSSAKINENVQEDESSGILVDNTQEEKSDDNDQESGCEEKSKSPPTIPGSSFELIATSLSTTVQDNKQQQQQGEEEGSSNGSYSVISTPSPPSSPKQQQQEEEAVEEEKDNHESSSSSSWSPSSKSSSSSSSSSSIKDPQTPQQQQQQQSSETIWKTIQTLHTQNQLYKGVTPIVTTMAISNFVFFYSLQFTKRFLLSSSSSTSSSSGKVSKSLLASSLAGIMNVLVTNPLWVANLRIVKGGKNSKHTGSNVWSEMMDIAKKEGISKLWNGTLASLLLVSNPTIQHFTYDLLKSRIIARSGGVRHPKNGGKQGGCVGMMMSPMEAFLIGALAKGIATIVTYPLQLAQVLLRLQEEEEEKKEDKQSSTSSSSKEKKKLLYKGTISCLLSLYQKGGLRAMYKGMNAKLLQTVLTAAFTFLTYEQILGVVQKSLVAFVSSSSSSSQSF